MVRQAHQSISRSSSPAWKARSRIHCRPLQRKAAWGGSLRGCPAKAAVRFLAHRGHLAQDLQFRAGTHTIRNRNRPAKQVGDQRRLNQHSLNRGSTRQSVLCAVSASPECLMNRGESHRLRTGSPAHCPRPRGSDFFFCEEFSPRPSASEISCPSSSSNRNAVILRRS